MAQTTSTSDPSGTPSQKSSLVPPDERFWQRYSQHGELPLSGATSVALHLLVFGFALMMAWLAYSVFNHTSRSLPVEAVRLDLGGGGGNPHGVGDGPGVGKAPEETGTAEAAPTHRDPTETVKRPDLKVEPGARKPFQFDDSAVRYIHRSETASSQALQKLAQANIRIQLPDGKAPGHGRGGTGEGGGSGDGKGTGTGDGRGEGHGKLTQREKRMLRWSMLFNTSNGRDYLSQLQGLGAILAVPVREDANGRDYRLIRDLSARPAKLLEEDIGKIQRIYWIDDKPQSVGDVMTILGVHLPTPPSHFVAFMPEKLEEKLFKLEKAYLAKKHPGRSEDDIEETKFRIHRRGAEFDPEVIDQRVK